MAFLRMAIKNEAFGVMQPFKQFTRFTPPGTRLAQRFEWVTWQQAAEILGMMLVRLPIADWPRVSALSSTLVAPSSPSAGSESTGHDLMATQPGAASSPVNKYYVRLCIPLLSSSTPVQQILLSLNNLRVDQPVAIPTQQHLILNPTQQTPPPPPPT